MTVSHKKLWSVPHKSFDPFGDESDVTDFTTDIEAVIRRMLVNFARSLDGEQAFSSVVQVDGIISDVVGRAFSREMMSAVKPHLSLSYEEGSKLALQKLDAVGVVTDNASRTMRGVRNALSGAVERATSRLADSTGGTFSVRLRELVGEGVEQGLSPRDLSKRIQVWAGENNDPERATAGRAMTIARTETRKAQIDAEVTSWKATGLITKKEWLVSPRHCEFCGAAGRKKAINLSDPFYKLGTTLAGTKGGLMRLDYETIMGPPLHPNCRCTLLPVAMRRR